MPFDFHNKDRIGNLLEELEELRYRNLQDIKEFDWYEDSGEVGNRQPVGEPEKVQIGFRWKGYDKYNWLCTKVIVPEELKSKEVIGLFDFGVRVGTGNNSHFESLLYLNGKPYQAVDGNHREVFLEVTKNGLELDLKFRVWSGLNGGGRPKEMAMELKRAQIGILDETTDKFFYLAKNALEAYQLLEPNNEYKEWILNELVKAFCFINYTNPASEEFYESIKKAYEYLDTTFDGRGKPEIKVSMIGHTHIDVAWLWRLCHTREKAARSFSTVNRYMEKYEDYRFLQSQPQLYEYIKTDYPDIYEQIQKRVKEKRWEPSGAMWVECDCNIASGESIVRQILVGKNFFMEEFGVESKMLWLPDVFGYSWALPQILKKSGVDTFMTTKISWNDTNKMPYDTFLWKGIDGTELLTHFITTTDDYDGAASYTYNGDSRPYAVKGVWDNYSNKDLNRELLISYGYGDGGGGPTRDMIMNISCLNKIPGIPTVQNEWATSYFERLHRTLEENPLNGYLPVWDGELYLEFHRGTYTSQSYNKRMNRKMEYALRDIEIYSVIADYFCNISYQREEILKAWKIVLTHQFHDILPGSSIREVYEDSHIEYEKAIALLTGVMEEVKKGLFIPSKDCYTLFNNSNWERDTYVTISDLAEDEILMTETGKQLKMTRGKKEAIVFIEKMKPFAFMTIKKQKQAKAKTENVLDKKEADTSYYHITWNEFGQLTSIFDKEAQREVLPQGKKGNVLQIFEDKPRCFDAWELESTIDLKMEEITSLVETSVQENEIGIFVHFVWNYNKSKIDQTMCLYYDKRRIDFKTTIDWQERQKLLKAAFPVEIRATDARFDIQYGNIKRPVTKNHSWESAKFEVAAHKWVDFSETGYGVALLNDCKYGHDIKENVMRISLLKAATDPDYAADIGTHVFTYSILPHRKEWYKAEIEQEAFDLNNPLIPVLGNQSISSDSILTGSIDNIEVDCIKMAEYSEHIIIRFHEYTGSHNTLQLKTIFPISSWYECDLLERKIEERKTTEVIELAIKPYEIKTIAILPKDKKI